MQLQPFLKFETLTLGPFYSFQLHCHEIEGVRASYLNGIALPPGQIPAKLKCLQAGEDVVIEPAAQAGRIVAADFEGLANLVTRSTRSFRTDDGGDNLVSIPRIFSHANPLLN